MIRLNRLSFQLLRQALEAERPTARVIMRTSTWTSSCGRLEASLASRSAVSFPGSPQCAGTHCRCTRRPPAESSRRRSHRAAPSAVVWAPAPLARVASAACESEQTTRGILYFVCMIQRYLYVLTTPVHIRTHSTSNKTDNISYCLPLSVR